MEKQAVLQIWGWSVEKNNMRYTGMLSDGDSVAYKAVCDANLYPVRKLECVSHCDKRTGTALRKKAMQERLCGHCYGALAANSSNLLQVILQECYYEEPGEEWQQWEWQLWNLSLIACHQMKAHGTRNTHRDWIGGASTIKLLPMDRIHWATKTTLEHHSLEMELELWSPPMRECRTPVSCKGLSMNEHKTRMSVWMELGQRWSMWVLTQWMLWRHLLSSFNQGCPHLSQVMEYPG